MSSQSTLFIVQPSCLHAGCKIKLPFSSLITISRFKFLYSLISFPLFFLCSCFLSIPFTSVHYVITNNVFLFILISFTISFILSFDFNFSVLHVRFMRAQADISQRVFSIYSFPFMALILYFLLIYLLWFNLLYLPFFYILINFNFIQCFILKLNFQPQEPQCLSLHVSIRYIFCLILHWCCY